MYVAAAEHLAKFGLIASKDPKAFKPSMNATQTQFSGKYMCGYEILQSKVPIHPNGSYNLEGIKQFMCEDEIFTFWHAPETLRDLVNTCHTCFRNFQFCKCKSVREKKDRPQRMTDDMKAKRRKQIASMNFAFD